MTLQKRDYKVLLVLISKSFGGAEVRVLTQARALQSLTTGCEVATLQGSMLHDRLQSEGLPHVVLTSGRGSPLMLMEMRSLMQRGDYDVIDAHNVQSILWGTWAAALAGIPQRVATVHSDFAAEYPGVKGHLYSRVLSVTRSVVSHTINVTEVLQQQAEKRGLGNTSTLIPNAVPIPETRLVQRRHDLAAEWGFSDDDFVIGIIGRLVPVKGHRYLLRALAQLPPRYKLVIVGTGALEDDLNALVGELGMDDRVHFTGFRKDIPDIMQNIDVLCMASLSEALPYVVLEASSYGRPLVLTRVGGLKTLITDGENGLLAEPEDADSLAEALKRVGDNSDLAETLGAASYELVKARFSLERMMADVLQVYDR